MVNVLPRLLEGVRERRLVFGHTHLPFRRMSASGEIELVNPGSVGMPYGGAGAHWALLDTTDGGVTLRVSRFDIDAACARLAAESAYPRIDEFADHFVRSRASDFDALRVFGPRDGR